MMNPDYPTKNATPNCTPKPPKKPPIKGADRGTKEKSARPDVVSILTPIVILPSWRGDYKVANALAANNIRRYEFLRILSIATGLVCGNA